MPSPQPVRRCSRPPSVLHWSQLATSRLCEHSRRRQPLPGASRSMARGRAQRLSCSRGEQPILAEDGMRRAMACATTRRAEQPPPHQSRAPECRTCSHFFHARGAFPQRHRRPFARRLRCRHPATRCPRRYRPRRQSSQSLPRRSMKRRHSIALAVSSSAGRDIQFCCPTRRTPTLLVRSESGSGTPHSARRFRVSMRRMPPPVRCRAATGRRSRRSPASVAAPRPQTWGSTWVTCSAWCGTR